MKNTYDYGLEINKESNQIISKIEVHKNQSISSIRDAYAFYISKIIKKNKKFVLLDADLGTVAKTLDLKKSLKKRYVQIGIAEQNAVGIAAGIAQYGKVPILQSLAVFLTGRAFDQIRESVAYSNLNVKLVGLHSGFTLSPDGATHQTGEDIALISSLPGVEIFAPADPKQLKRLLPKFLNSKKPSYLRLFFPKVKNVTNNKFEFKKIEILKKISKINIISYGYMLQKSIEAHEILKKNNLNSGLINIHCLKPLDFKGILKVAKKSELLIIIEDHNQYGGLGSIISQFLSEHSPVKILSINSKDKFGTTGLPEENLNYLGLSVESIVKKIINHAK